MGIGSDLNQAAAFESGDDAAHGGRFDLLGGGEFAKRFGAGKDENREGRKLSRADSGGCVLQANAAEQMDGGGMEAIGGREGLWAGRDVAGFGTFRLDFRHRI